MAATRTFGEKIGAGFAGMVLLALSVGGVSVYALRTVVASKDEVIARNAQSLIEAQEMNADRAQIAASLRGYLLTKDERYLEEIRVKRAGFRETLQRLVLGATSTEERSLLTQIAQALDSYGQACDRVIGIRRTNAPLETAIARFEEEVVPLHDPLNASTRDFAAREEKLLEEGRLASSETAASAVALVSVLTLAIFLFGAVAAYFLTRTLSRQVGAAVGQVQNSSTELQTAAHQQSSGAKEQVSAMSEIATTVSELLATSRQIAESAQRVAEIARDTAGAAGNGEATLERAGESMAAIRRQVDLVVTRMLDLGKKSQEIGSVLDIVTELAEQTNILSVNATIEAVGAGEAGRRFGTVAEEIRRLAERVAASAKEIRSLIEDVRSSVNTTVMATEGGAKAVEAGAKEFAEVAASFRRITGLVGTTTEAGREIELSTKQQSTAVEQVNSAITSVAQATRETEASTTQTFQTATQLADLSRDLLLLVRRAEAAVA